jgi:hypothetical protein
MLLFRALVDTLSIRYWRLFSANLGLIEKPDKHRTIYFQLLPLQANVGANGHSPLQQLYDV